MLKFYGLDTEDPKTTVDVSLLNVMLVNVNKEENDTMVTEIALNGTSIHSLVGRLNFRS